MSIGFELWLERLQHGRVTRFVFWPVYVVGGFLLMMVLSAVFLAVYYTAVFGLGEVLHRLAALFV